MYQTSAPKPISPALKSHKKGLASFAYVISWYPLGAKLLTVRQSRAEPVVGPPIRRKFVQVQSEAGTGIGAVVPVRTT